MRSRRYESTPATIRPGLIVIGCSLGGLQALGAILSALPPDFDVPVAIAQHRHHDSTGTLATVLQRSSLLEIRDAEDGEPIRAGVIRLAPADYHLLVDRHTFHLSTEKAVQFSRPSVDVLFESAADSWRAEVIGVILTGANRDGAEGAAAIRRHRGLVVVQDPATAEAESMPRAALEVSGADAILPLAEIGPWLVRACGRERAHV